MLLLTVSYRKKLGEQYVLVAPPNNFVGGAPSVPPVPANMTPTLCATVMHAVRSAIIVDI